MTDCRQDNKRENEMSNLDWVHPNNEFWYYGEFNLDGEIDTRERYGTIRGGDKKKFLCFATGQLMQVAKNLEDAKKLVETMVKGDS